MSSPTQAPFPLAAADQCVRCGLCLPHCPTYGIARDEGESPRGRIGLMQGLASGQLAPDAALAAHLEQCLGCRACEVVCPAQVPYGELIDAGRAELLARGVRRGRLTRAIAALAASPAAGVLAGAALRIWSGSGLQRRWRAATRTRAGRIVQAERLLPDVYTRLPRPGRYPAIGTRRGEVAVFRGCINPRLDPRTLNDAVDVLRRYGFDVHVPDSGCCGALHQHAGLPGGARRHARRVLGAFSAIPDAPVVSVVSGCAATLLEYDRIADAGSDFGARVTDVCALLAAHDPPANLAHGAIRQHVAVHEPCTLRNVVRASGAAIALLQRIPGLTCEPLAGNAVCCGAAGSYLLTQPGIAEALRAPKLDALKAAHATCLATSNIGCAMHLRAGIGRGNIDVVHPVTLLARSLAAGRGDPI